MGSTIVVCCCVVLTFSVFKGNMDASEPSEHPPPRETLSYNLGGNIGCRDKNSSWYKKGPPM